MLEDMLRIIRRRYYELNPHKARQLRISTGTATPEEIYQYTQEVDNEGMTQEEIDMQEKTLCPAIEWRLLEQLAAEEYLVNTLGANPRQAVPSLRKQESDKKEEQPAKANPRLSFKQLQEELRKNHHESDAVRQAVKRSISINFGRAAYPWEIGGCARDYRIVNARVSNNRESPTPATCQYEKTDQSGTD